MSARGTAHRASLAFDLVLKVLVTATLLCIAVITFVDVIGRYFFNAPIPGAFEVQEFGMGILIFSGLPLVTKSHGHITVSLFDPLFQRNSAIRSAKVGLIHLASSGILFFVAYCLSVQAMNMQRWGSASAFLKLPYYPALWFMAAMAALSGVMFLGFAVQAFAGRLDDATDQEKGSIL